MVADDGGSTPLALTVTVDVLSVNDAPTDLNRAGTKVPTTLAAGDEVYDFTATDEETTNQADFTFELAKEATDGAEDFADNAYFEFDGQTLKFKSDLGGC